MYDDCQILDVNIDIGGRVVYTSKLIADVDPPSTFANIVEEAIQEYAESALNPDISEDELNEDDDDPVKREAQHLVSRVKSIKCTGRDRSAELLKFLQKSNIPLKSLDSISSPIFRTGITIKIGKPIAESAPAPASKPKINPFAIMMGAGNPTELKFITPPPLQPNPTLDVQIRTKLYEHLIDINLGYYNPDQKSLIVINIGKITNTLCMIEKHWHKFFYKDFPNVPDKCIKYDLIQLTAQCMRNTALKSERLIYERVVSHLTTLTSLGWTAFSSAKSIKKALDMLKEDIADVCIVLNEKKLSMLRHNSIVSPKPVAPVFKSLPSFVQLDDDNNEFYVCILPSTKKTPKRGTPSSQLLSIRHSIKNIAQVLRHADDYHPLHITDEDMGIVDNAFSSVGGTVSLDSNDRSFYRKAFKAELAKGIERMGINIFGRSSSTGPSCLFVWKTPLVHGDAHAGNVQLSINKCRDIIPKKVSAQSALHFNNILRGIANVPAEVRKALTSYLFGGEINVKGADADMYYEFVENLAGGFPIDDSWIVDGRAFNSRGGKGINSTSFEEFWEECRR